ncbi:MAG: HU family DNA-binding protein [Actinomycetaceae bacterium]|nr:HU family DNA-binding protein [Actinomycetaceae bacterium]
MNRSDIVSQIAQRSGLTHSQADHAFMVFQDLMLECISQGEQMNVTGFFSVSRVKRAARTGRNPRTGEEIQIPEGYGVKITPGSTVKNAAKTSKEK